MAQINDLGIKTVVIDPGHGGKDAGCHGKNTKEKDIALAIGLKLGEAIKRKFPEINLIYTRTEDVFVELSDRAKIANEKKADLFICIHANSASPYSYGCETFVLGLHKTETQKKIAERENSQIFLEDDKGEKYKNFDMSPDALIARSFQLSIFLNQSIDFASKIQNEFKRLGRHDRGVKQAGFLVLYQTMMPSVLIETGFLTNETEEAFLKDTSNQNLMAKSIFKAFEKYKKEQEGINHLIAKDSNAIITQNYNIKDNINENDVVFKVQITTSKTKIKNLEKKFKGLKVFEYKQDGLYKYTVGEFKNNFKNANKYKRELRKNDYKYAFVVAFVKNERINLKKAIKLAENYRN